jgi:hypothetical protein
VDARQQRVEQALAFGRRTAVSADRRHLSRHGA